MSCWMRVVMNLIMHCSWSGGRPVAEMLAEELTNEVRPGAFFMPFEGVVVVVVVVDDDELSLPLLVELRVEDEDEDDDVRMVYKMSSKTDGRSNLSLSSTLINRILYGGFSIIKFCLNITSITSHAFTPSTVSKLLNTASVSTCNMLIRGLFSNNMR